jgi:hypothetical protein
MIRSARAGFMGQKYFSVVDIPWGFLRDTVFVTAIDVSGRKRDGGRVTGRMRVVRGPNQGFYGPRSPRTSASTSETGAIPAIQSCKARTRGAGFWAMASSAFTTATQPGTVVTQVTP